MRAWQVNEFEGDIVGLQQANVPLDRNARVVADTLAQTRQSIEECALTGIRTADNRNAGARRPVYGNVFYGYASFG